MLQFKGNSFIRIRLGIPSYYVVVTGEDGSYYKISGPYTIKQNAEERFDTFKAFYQTSPHWEKQREQGCVPQLIEVHVAHTLIK